MNFLGFVLRLWFAGTFLNSGTEDHPATDFLRDIMRERDSVCVNVFFGGIGDGC